MCHGYVFTWELGARVDTNGRVTTVEAIYPYNYRKPKMRPCPLKGSRVVRGVKWGYVQ